MISHERSQSLANDFIHALRICERDGNVAPLVELFSEKALLGNILFHHPMHGKSGAQVFWQDYRRTFQDVHSHFTHVNGGGPVMALEWLSEGVLRSGKPFQYRGVSLLEFDEDDSGKITRFQAYYDVSALSNPNGGYPEREVSSAA